MIDNELFGVNGEEVADTSNKSKDSAFDSQFEDSEHEDEGVEVSEVAEPDEDSEDVEETPEARLSQTPDENAKYAAARRQADLEKRQLVERQNSFARRYGYNSFEEMEQAEKQQNYVSQGYDENMAKKMVQIDHMLAETESQNNRVRIAEEKIRLSSRPFFKDLEADIDALLTQQPGLPVELVFNVLKGEKMDELVKNSKKAAQQKALNNLGSKSHIKPDGKGTDVDVVKLDESEWNFYRKLNPKAKKDDYVKFLKSEKRR